MNATQEQLKLKLTQALVAAFGADYTNTDPILVSASNPKFGDYQANVALSLSKKLGKPPRIIAGEIVNKLDVSDICEPPEIAGPGFINLKLQTSYLEAQLNAIQLDSRLGIPKATIPQKQIVDFSSPNIAKEMHVGHLRSTIIGDSIARILEFCGHDVLRLNHVGDWGTQFGMLITHLVDCYPDLQGIMFMETPLGNYLLGDVNIGDLVEFYRESKKKFDNDEEFRERSRKAVVSLQSGDKFTKDAWDLLCEASRKEFKIIYDLLNIKLIERGESFYNPLLPKVVKDLAATGLLEESQGAKCVFLDGFTNREGNPLPLIVQKSDGGYNYATTDLAALRYRIQEDKAKRIVYVTDEGQSNHFSQFFQVAKKANWIPNDVELVHVPFGLVLGEDGKKFKTRSGDTVRLRDLLDEAINRARADIEKRLQEDGRTETEEFIQNVAEVVGISAVKYADLSQNRTSSYVFSYDKMLSLKGNTAPYLLYAYVRIQGISRQGNIDFANLGINRQILLKEDAELTLGKHLLQLDEVIKEVEQDLLPNRLCDYLYQLSDKFNKFYENCPVLKSEEPARTSRLMLCDLTAKTLKLGLSLLGIKVLERM
ncbi:arginine--tRNA ligase [Aphanizomenon flos-aquae NRERC-008]|uniref:Arginine--tRNA ligase n=1 Tax=Aphanizomenon flos-aquae FACHB-1249 TaxID=2692889 RepID=A0ABR8IN22_APHFL|nr:MULTISPECIES: arginine--tRNA ligase [Aphanizomenon]MBD2391748.1 arginine--tRNA ligase [Aphanizomenon flos-aquae FACHB-1171]MBD2557446.1 arginine--tRNA ligase [Aphanizomenon flos-aquae FACHB-1290]MBD2632338.1 arginine--tRNA ligase [Aphanizomenon sp. FACHB-1399]MBD2643201.1 arginine--tRNA ligase [Aphanizomenon sp. FACHB-1401]MBD2657169.1 arginine--tRNA ligase [Aphanizomenon flos-aquae FACHB-1265]